MSPEDYYVLTHMSVHTFDRLVKMLSVGPKTYLSNDQRGWVVQNLKVVLEMMKLVHTPEAVMNLCKATIYEFTVSSRKVKFLELSVMETALNLLTDTIPREVFKLSHHSEDPKVIFQSITSRDSLMLPLPFVSLGVVAISVNQATERVSILTTLEVEDFWTRVEGMPDLGYPTSSLKKIIVCHGGHPKPWGRED